MTRGINRPLERHKQLATPGPSSSARQFASSTAVFIGAVIVIVTAVITRYYL